MKELPKLPTRYLEKILERRFRPAFLSVDAEGVISQVGGDLAAFDLAHLELGMRADLKVDCLYGLLPVERAISLPWVEFPSGQVVDVHITDPAEKTWVIFLDVTREAKIEKRSQQAIYDVNLIREQLADRLTSSSITSSSADLLARIMAQLDTVIFCYDEGGRVSLVGRPPRWFHEIYPKSLVKTQDLEPWSRFPFLAHFLDEAEGFWSEDSTHALRSGPWTESGWFGEELLLEARALLVEGAKFLLVSRLSDDDPRVKIYRAREMELVRSHRIQEGDRRNQVLEAELESKAEALSEMNRRLESQNARLTLNRAKLRSLTYELTQAEERERRRIAEGLHDHIGQMLAGIKIRLGVLRQSASGGSPDALSQIDQSLGEVIRYTRNLTFELGSPILYEFGFMAGVQDLLERIGKNYGFEIIIEGDVEDTRWGEELRLILFQTVRELLHNIVKHAQAKTVTVRCHEKQRTLYLSVEDDGLGFDVNRLKPDRLEDRGFGLFSVQDRLDFFGGTFEAFSKPREGTKIMIQVPLPRGSSPDGGASS